MNRIEFVMFFDVTDGNPNGNPDAGNMPRQDPETGRGLVTDVMLKRKIRNFIETTLENKPGFAIQIREKAILNRQKEAIYKELDLNSPSSKTKLSGQEKVALAQAAMCQTYIDVRMFGAVMNTGEKEDRCDCGKVRGPVQISFALSVDPITVDDHCITRCAVTSQKQADSQDGGTQGMGRKYTVPYGLYRVHGFINPYLAEQTGFSDQDLAILWEALVKCFWLDRSAGRSRMDCRRLIEFRHSSKLGEAHPWKLFNLVTVEKTTETPRRYEDYKVDVGVPPTGVEVIEHIVD